MNRFRSLTFKYLRNRHCHPAWTVFLALFPLLALSGCAAVQVKLGMKVYLAKTPITSIEVSQPKGPGIGPGQKSPLVVVITEPDGKVLQTEGAGKGKVMWQDLQVAATIVTVNKKGVVTLPHDPRKSEGKLPQVTIAVPSHPDLHAELDIPLRYDYNFVSNFSGSSGSSGMNGGDGSDGMSGSSGSMDPDNPSAGGNGSNGGDGSNGSDGSNGGRCAAGAGPGGAHAWKPSSSPVECICGRPQKAVPGGSPGRFADGEG